MSHAVTGETFEAQVLQSEQAVLVDFWAEWCGPCHAVAPVLEKIVDERPDEVKLVKVNIDEEQELAQRYGVMSIPTIILFRDGEPSAAVIGAQPKGAIERALGLGVPALARDRILPPGPEHLAHVREADLVVRRQLSRREPAQLRRVVAGDRIATCHTRRPVGVQRRRGVGPVAVPVEPMPTNSTGSTSRPVSSRSSRRSASSGCSASSRKPPGTSQVPPYGSGLSAQAAGGPRRR